MHTFALLTNLVSGELHVYSLISCIISIVNDVGVQSGKNGELDHPTWMQKAAHIAHKIHSLHRHRPSCTRNIPGCAMGAVIDYSLWLLVMSH